MFSKILDYFKNNIIALLGAVSFCTLVGASIASYLYVDTQKELSALQEQYKSLQRDYNELANSKDKLRQSCDVTKDSLSKLQSDISKAKSSSDSSVEGIATYKPKLNKSIDKKQSIEEGNNETEYVDIDKPFDPEFIRVSESGL